MSITAADITKLQVQDGDMLVIRVPEESDQKIIEDLLTTIRAAGANPAGVILLINDATIEALAENEMRACGWERIAQVENGVAK